MKKIVLIGLIGLVLLSGCGTSGVDNSRIAVYACEPVSENFILQSDKIVSETTGVSCEFSEEEISSIGYIHVDSRAELFPEKVGVLMLGPLVNPFFDKRTTVIVFDFRGAPDFVLTGIGNTALEAD